MIIEVQLNKLHILLKVSLTMISISLVLLVVQNIIRCNLHEVLIVIVNVTRWQWTLFTSANTSTSGSTKRTSNTFYTSW